MVVGEMPTWSDIVVIGGGPGGYTAALRAAERGGSVTLVEREALGGVCLNVGCIPSKALIHSAEIAELGRLRTPMGIEVSTTVDMGAVRKNLEATVGRLVSGITGLLESAGIRVLRGTARFTRQNRLSIVDHDRVEHIEFDQCIVATGSRPVELSAFPVDGVRILDSTGALGLSDLPSRLAVIGGGYIGVELGTAFAKLGSTVSVIEFAERLLPGLPAELGRPVHRRLTQLGVEVLVGHRAVEPTSAGLIVDDGAGQRRALDADVIVVAVGRRPNTAEVGFERAGVTLAASGHVPVDAGRRAGPTILAIGDITEGPALAHKATAEAEVAAATACGEPARFDPAAVPEIVFSDPEVVSVGWTASAAERAGIDTTSFRFPFAASGRALTLGRDDGHAELVADREGTVVGAQLVGPGVSELAGELALAIEMAATVEDLAGVIHPHPTLSEAIMEAAFGLDGRPLHVRKGDARVSR